ncbi:MAG: ribosomal-processing cysteine protease Prp [Clostridiales bacterium]|nr:ribosomal-processing cysteine protease Prp [Clostridiales bacterium]
MIRVTLIRAGEKFLGFECKGHAGYAPAGSDIICAAVSILTTTCVNALESVAGKEAEAEVKDGYMRVLLSETETTEKTQIIFATIAQGLSDLAEEYPKYLRLTEN